MLASAGYCGTGLPGTQELARINEDARATPRLPGSNGMTHNANADNTICHMASLPWELLH